MRKNALTFLSVLFGFLFLTAQNAGAAGDADAIKKLSSFKSTGLSTGGEKIPQKSELADNIKKNILPLIKLPAGFNISKSCGSLVFRLKSANSESSEIVVAMFVTPW